MIIEKVIRKLKRDPDYKWESSYSLRDLIIIVSVRLIQILRGFMTKIYFNKSEGFMFIGQNVKVRHAYKIMSGKNLILEDNVYLNALSENGIRLGDNVSIGRDSILVCYGVIASKGVGITIGNGTGINAGAYIGGQGGVDIGDNVIIGPHVKIFSENHNFSHGDIPIKNQGVTRGKVTIKNNCWIGSGATILAGVTIGEGCVVGAGTVVTKSTPDNVVIAGIPGKVIKHRLE